MSTPVVGFITCASQAEARRLAKAVLDKRAAACVNILRGIESHYWWQGKQQRATEWLLVLKTTRSAIKEVINVIKHHHSYDTPEIIFLPIITGERRYLAWLRQSVAILTLGLSLAVNAGIAQSDTIDDLKKQLGHAEEEMRAEAADKLAQTGGERVVKIFRELVASPNPERRMMGVAGLLQVSEADEDVARVRDRLKDENTLVRWSAALALGHSRRPEAVAWLDDIAAQDSAESVREAATEAANRLRAGVQWTRPLADALRRARESGRQVMLYFTIPSLDLCRQFEEGVLADPNVVAATRPFLCVRLDATAEENLVKRYDVRGAPTVLILDSKGDEIARVSGMTEPATMTATLNGTGADQMSLRDAKRIAARDPGNCQAQWIVAKHYLDQDQHDRAMPHLKNIIAHDEQNTAGFTPDAMFALGYCYGKRREHAAAVYCMEQLLKRWPTFKDREKTLYCLALSQLAIGKKAQGRVSLETLLREYPSGALAKTAAPILSRLNTEPKP